MPMYVPQESHYNSLTYSDLIKTNPDNFKFESSKNTPRNNNTFSEESTQFSTQCHITVIHQEKLKPPKIRNFYHSKKSNP